MNKLLFLIACLAMSILVVIGAAFAFAPAPHEHVYSSSNTAPTCVAEGGTTFTCACGDSYTETTPALGHTEVEIAGKEATCTESGLTVGKKCTVCGETTKAQETIPALGHALIIEEAVAPTCTESGLTAGEGCSRCDYTVTQETVPALGHDMVTDAAVEPNCNVNGFTEGAHCTRCDHKEGQDIIPALGHDVKILASLAPTCTENGLRQGYYCARCDGYYIKQDVVPALGHDYDNHQDLICNRCSYERLPCAHPETEDIAPAKAATCTEAGLTAGKKCVECGEIVEPQQLIEKLGHNIVVDAEKAPTCTETGLTAGEHCTRCDYKVAQDVVNALGHTAKTLPAVAPKCFATGLTEGSGCSVCGEVLTAQTPVAALGAHTWNGVNCTVCNAVKFEGETADITYIMLEGTTRVVSVGREGKTVEDTNYPSGEGFVYFMSSALTTTLKFQVTASVDGAASISVRMGRATYDAYLENLLYVQVNGTKVESYPDIVFPKYSTINYYDWYELVIADVELKAGNNVIELIKPIPEDPANSDNARFGLNLDYMSVIPENPEMVIEITLEKNNGHSYEWTYVTFPTYESAGSTYGYCKYCRDKQDVDLPVISAENGYTKLYSGVMSRWEYDYNGHKIHVDVPEESQKYMFDVTVEDDIFTSVVDNNGIGDGTDKYNTNKHKNSYGSFYELTQNATFTLEVSVEEASDVVFILRLRSTANTTYKCGEIIKSISVINGDKAVPSEIRNDNITFLGWSPENTVDAELAVLSLQPGKNVITFTMAGLNVNISGVGFGAFVPVYHEPITPYGGNLTTFDPFLAENGGTYVDNDTTNKNDGWNAGGYYQNIRNSVLSFKVTVDEPTTIRLRLGLAFNKSAGYNTTDIATITSTNASGQANNVKATSITAKNTKWTAADAVIIEFATIELAAGENTITINMGANNVNISAVYVAANNEVVIGKKN